MNLYKFFWDVGRMGIVGGMFLADSETVEAAIGKEVYFGEILGKYSEIYGPLEVGDLEQIPLTAEVEAFFKEHFGTGTISGYNPLEYLNDSEEDDEE